MSESSEILFDTILKMKAVAITDVHEKKYVLYFRANGHRFCCAAGRVYHEKHPFYGSPIAENLASRERDPKRIVKEKEDADQFNKNWDGWMDHQDKIIEHAFTDMLPHIMLGQMDKAKHVFEYYFDCILPGKGAEKMIKKLNKNN